MASKASIPFRVRFLVLLLSLLIIASTASAYTQPSLRRRAESSASNTASKSTSATGKSTSTNEKSTSTTKKSTSTTEKSTSTTDESTSEPFGLISTSLTIATLEGYSYVGCFEDDTNTRLFSAAAGYGFANKNLTYNSPSECLVNCHNNTFSSANYVGVEYSTNCFCAVGTTVNPGKYTTRPTGCTKPCGADPGAHCGGANAIDVYTLTATTASSSASPSSASPSSTDAPSDGGSSSLTGGAIAGIAIGSALGGILVAVAGFVLLRRRRRSAPKYEQANPTSPTSTPPSHYGNIPVSQMEMVKPAGPVPKPQEIPADHEIYEMANNPAPPRPYEM